MIKRKNSNVPAHRAGNIVTEAVSGFKEISGYVEGLIPVRGATMLDKFSENLSLVRSNASLTSAQAQPAVGVASTRSAATRSCMTVTNNVFGQVFPILVHRTSHNIPVMLPYILFAPVNLIEGYNSIFRSLSRFPADIITSIAFINSGADLEITYTKGLLVDTIVISSEDDVPYSVKLEMLKTDYIQANGIKYTVGTGNFDLQINSSSLQFGRSSFQGIIDKGSVPPSVFKRTDQNIVNIINIDCTVVGNSRRWISLGMAPSITTPGDAYVKLDIALEDYDSSVDFDGCSVVKN